LENATENEIKMKSKMLFATISKSKMKRKSRWDWKRNWNV